MDVLLDGDRVYINQGVGQAGWEDGTIVGALVDDGRIAYQVMLDHEPNLPPVLCRRNQLKRIPDTGRDEPWK